MAPRFLDLQNINRKLAGSDPQLLRFLPVLLVRFRPPNTVGPRMRPLCTVFFPNFWH